MPFPATAGRGPAILALGSAVAMFRWKTGMIPTLLTCAAVGLLATLVLGA